METTLTIIKPDSVAAGNSGRIIAHLEAEGFRIRGMRRLRLSKRQARAFYEVHEERPFYDDLVAFMTEGAVIAAALDREDAVSHLRAVMGSTNPADAAEGTIRALYGTSIERNAIHGSDSRENAANEVAFFFAQAELIG